MQRIGEGSIQARGLLDYRGFPIKTYIFAADFGRLYGSVREAMHEIAHAIDADGPLRSRSGHPIWYAIAFPWGVIDHGGPVRNVDVYAYEFDGPWSSCNPEWEANVFRNRHLRPNGTDGCGTDVILLGKEEDMRRKLIVQGADMARYLHAWPGIAYLGPREENIMNISFPDS